MRTVNEFTDQELDHQIEILKDMDVMGSKKLLNSFLEEKARREELHKKEEELKQKQIAEEEKKQSEEKREIAKAFADIYNKCYKVEKGADGIIQYYHVRGLVDDIVVTDIVYRQEFTKGNAYTLSTEVNKFIRFEVFKNITKKENEIPLKEFNSAQGCGLFNSCFDSIFKTLGFKN